MMFKSGRLSGVRGIPYDFFEYKYGQLADCAGLALVNHVATIRLETVKNIVRFRATDPSLLDSINTAYVMHRILSGEHKGKHFSLFMLPQSDYKLVKYAFASVTDSPEVGVGAITCDLG